MDGHNRIRAIRRKKGLTLKQLAIEAKITPGALSLIERGERIPRVDTALRIALALETTVERLYRIEKE